MPNGHTTQLTFPRQEVFDVGDVLLVGTDFYRKVPHDVWPLKPRVGIGAVRSTKAWSWRLPTASVQMAHTSAPPSSESSVVPN